MLSVSVCKHCKFSQILRELNVTQDTFELYYLYRKYHKHKKEESLQLNVGSPQTQITGNDVAWQLANYLELLGAGWSPFDESVSAITYRNRYNWSQSYDF
jgi:hypothetical protein